MAQNEPLISWVLERAVILNGDGASTIDLGTAERRTWIETKRRVDGVASGLLGLGLQRGARVGVLMLNSARHLELWFAIPAAGLVMNDLNYRLAAPELAFISGDSDIEVLFVDDTHLEVGRDLLATVDSITTLVWTGPGHDAPSGTVAYESLAATDQIELPSADAGDLAAIFYTGGTTGLPKGAMLSHRNLTANALHAMSVARLTASDRYLHAAPQFHLADGALSYSLTWAGGAHVFIPAFEPSRAVTALADERCTLVLLVPTMISMILASGAIAGADMSALRLLMYGASPMPSAVQQSAIEQFGCGLMQLYGMTEAAPIVTCLDEETHRRGAAGDEPFASRLRSAGVPIAGLRVQVRDEEGHIAPAGQAGEIFIQGPNIMGGYWNRPDETAHALVDGWYRSGDVAFADDGGFLFVVDRMKDMIISGGENVYTSEVENAVYLHPAVAEAAVFGIPDDGLGEKVHAEVVVKPGHTLTEAELVAHCRLHIAGYKLPRSVSIRESDQPLPKSGAGKIRKLDLRQPFWHGHTRSVS